MKKNGSKKTIHLLLIAAWLILAVIFAAYDLQISMKFVNQQSRFGAFMEVMGELAMPFLCWCGAIILLRCHQAEKSKKYCFVIDFLFLAVSFSYGYLLIWKSWGLQLKSILYMIATTLIFMVLAIILMRLSKQQLQKLKNVAIVTFWLAICSLLTVSVIKTFWGRLRFRDMTQPIQQFTYWFLPSGITGNKSFPSGHTTNASMTIVLTMLAPYAKHKVGKVLLWVFPVLWILFMAISRVRIGAHFASDVLFGAGITITLFCIIRYLVEKKSAEDDKAMSPN